MLSKTVSYFGKAAKKKRWACCRGHHSVGFHRNFNLSSSLDLSHRVEENKFQLIFIRQNFDSFLAIMI